MANYALIHEMFVRRVGVTMVAHHLGVGNPDSALAEWVYHWDSLGIWVVGPFNLAKSKILADEDHIFWDALHPKLADVDPSGYACGYKADSYRVRQPTFNMWADTQEDLRLRKMFIDEMNARLKLQREHIVQWTPNDSALAEAYGAVNWAPVDGPGWLSLKPERIQVCPAIRTTIPMASDSGCAGGFTWIVDDQELSHPALDLTNHMVPFPPTQELGASCTQWDPFGHRWGRGSHWPLMISMGTARYRSEKSHNTRSHDKYLRNLQEGASLGPGEGQVHGRCLERREGQAPHWKGEIEGLRWRPACNR